MIFLIRGTTIIAVKNGERIAMAGDGQVTMGQNMIMKHGARKVRKLYQGKILAGFAGSVADAFTLFERFEKKLEEYNGNLPRAAVELAKSWRTDRTLRNLEAMLIAVSKDNLLIISGTGEVIEPDDGIAAIGSGGAYALSAARALMKFTDFTPGKIARSAMEIAASICVYTNDNIILEEI